MKTIARFFAPLLFAPLLHAAVTVSAPVTLRDRILNNRGSFSGFTSIAQSDGSFVVAWKDLAGDRNEHLYLAPLASLYSALDTTRTVDAGPAAGPFLQSGGPYYLVSYAVASPGQRVRIYDRDLAPVFGPATIATGADPFQFMWNGREFMAPGTPRLTFVDTTGVRQAATPLDTASFPPNTVWVGAALPDGSQALVLGWPTNFCFDICSTPPVTMTAYTLDDAHRTQAQTVISNLANPEATVAASSAGFLVLWFDRKNLAETATALDASGTITGSVVLRTNVDLSLSTERRLIAGDGDEWLIVDGGNLVQIAGNAIVSKTPVTVGISPRFIRTGPGTYALIYIDASDPIFAKIELVRITTTSPRPRGIRH